MVHKQELDNITQTKTRQTRRFAGLPRYRDYWGYSQAPAAGYIIETCAQVFYW